MIISPGRGYIFVHIPKTGGTAMALALEARAKKDDVMIGDTPKALKRRHRVNGSKAAGRVWKHATLSDIDGLYSVEDLAPLFAFRRCIALHHPRASCNARPDWHAGWRRSGDASESRKTRGSLQE